MPAPIAYRSSVDVGESETILTGFAFSVIVPAPVVILTGYAAAAAAGSASAATARMAIAHFRFLIVHSFRSEALDPGA